MRTLSSSLLAAQRAASHIPYVKVEVTNASCGVVRYNWERLYTGSEDDYCHAVTMPSDGSLVRVRVTPPVDSRKLYRQRVANPGPSSDFSTWTYASQYNVLAVAACSLGAEVSIFWINGDREIYQLKSTDSGINWGSPELIGYSATSAIGGMAASYKSNGDIALFFADQTNLYVMKRISGSWGGRVAWDKSTGNLSGVATVYAGDWNLVVTGRDSGDNFKLWSLVYGDGGEVAVGTWSSLKEVASAPSDGDFEYQSPFMDKPDVYRVFFVEKYAGTEAYARPFWSHIVAESSFLSSLWHEPVPFDLSGDYGLAIAHHGDYCWLSAPYGVWRAKLVLQRIDLTGDVLSVREELEENRGKLVVELRNDNGYYASPGSGDLSVLTLGCQLEFSPGYCTSSGNESSPGQAFALDAYEHTSSGGKASFILYATDAWSLIENWRARHQFRWNKVTDEMCVKDILGFILARVGLKLEVKSQSSVITGYYPDFTISANDRGDAIVNKLLSFVPDVLFIEGNKAYLVSPQSTDSSVYSYGTGHAVLEGRYRQGAWEYNRVQVEGYDPVGGQALIVNCFGWEEIGKFDDRLRYVEDRNLVTVAEAGARGEAYLREAGIYSAGGSIRIPVNCGQQLYDVIDITDSRGGLSAEKKRVLGLILVFNTRRAQYEQQLVLGSV
jgi:hypothetical protein